MTLNEFLKELAKTPRDWVIGDDGMGGRQGIRLSNCCPLEVVAGTGAFFVEGARLRLKMRNPTASRLIHAADEATEHSDYDPKLRAQLLNACGLEGEATER